MVYVAEKSLSNFGAYNQVYQSLFSQKRPSLAEAGVSLFCTILKLQVACVRQRDAPRGFDTLEENKDSVVYT